MAVANGIDTNPGHDTSIALKATDPEAVPGLVEQINSLAEDFRSDDEQARRQLAAKAKMLWQSLETPRETMIRHCWAQVSMVVV